jgi:hypothetical protein
LDLELSNATSSICWIFVPLFDEPHNPKVASSNLAPATISLTYKGLSVASDKPFFNLEKTSCEVIEDLLAPLSRPVTRRIIRMDLMFPSASPRDIVGNR